MTDVIVISHFGLLFALFTPLKPKKSKFLKKQKRCLEISSFYKCVPKIMIRSCTVPKIWYMTDIIVIFHFGLFFALLLPSQLEKSKFRKYEKKPSGDIIILHMCTKNYDQMMYGP